MATADLAVAGSVDPEAASEAQEAPAVLTVLAGVVEDLEVPMVAHSDQ